MAKNSGLWGSGALRDDHNEVLVTHKLLAYNEVPITHNFITGLRMRVFSSHKLGW